MQSVPTAIWPRPRCTAWRMLVAGLGLTSLGGLLAWAGSLQEWALWPTGAALLVACLAAAAACEVAFQRPDELRFEEGHWWMSDGLGKPFVPGELTVAMDLSFAMLLRFEADGRGTSRRWLPVHRPQWGAAWHPLRLAVYSPRARKGGQHGGDGPQTGTNRPD